MKPLYMWTNILHAYLELELASLLIAAIVIVLVFSLLDLESKENDR